MIRAIVLGMLTWAALLWASVGVADQAPLAGARGDQRMCHILRAAPMTPVTKDGAYDVGIGIFPISIRDIAPSENTAEIDFYLTVEYMIDGTHPNVKCVGADSANVWKLFYNPDIELMTISDPEYLQGEHWMVEDGRFAFMTRARGTVTLNGDFRLFPFDRLNVRITVAGEDSNKYLMFRPSDWYHPDLAALRDEFKGLQIPGWRLEAADFDQMTPLDEEYWDELSLVLDIKREPLTFFMRSTVPLTLLFLIAFFSFRINENTGLPDGKDSFVETRLAIQVGTLLALFAYSLYVMEVIPDTSYLTMGDLNWLCFMLASLFIILSEYIPNTIVVGGRSLAMKASFLAVAVGAAVLAVLPQLVLLIVW